MTFPKYPTVDPKQVLEDVPFDETIVEILSTEFDGIPTYLCDEEQERLYENRRAVFAFGLAFALAVAEAPLADRARAASAAVGLLESAGFRRADRAGAPRGQQPR